MDSVAAYAARLDAMEAQAARLVGTAPLVDRWGGGVAARFRLDPHRPLEPELSLIGEFLAPGDVLLDVGGGAGRVGLPLAGRCQEVINVEPSPGMAAAFDDAARAAGIANARAVVADWLAADETGDVAITVNVTYFVRDIVPFVEKLHAAARKRVAIVVVSEPPPSNFAELFEVVFDERPQARPGHRELLPVLWDLGILPDIHAMPPRAAPNPPAPTRAAAVDALLAQLGAQLGADAARHPGLRERLEARFDRVFRATDGGYTWPWVTGARFLVITWPTSQRVGRPGGTVA